MLVRRKLFLSGVVLLVLLCFSLVPSGKAASMWSRAYGGSGDDCAYSLVATSDGGYALVGSTRSFGAGSDDVWLIKTDANGNMQWNKTYGGGFSDCAYSLVGTADGGYAMAGYTDSFGAGSDDFWLIKTDANGNMQWNKTYGGANSDIGRSLVVAPDGGFAIAGYTSSYGAGAYDAWLVKTDANGNMQWNKTYGGIWSDYVFSLVNSPDGGYALFGLTYSLYTEVYDLTLPDVWLIKTDALGNMQWNKTYGLGVYDEHGYSLAATSDGGYALFGCMSSFGYPCLVKTDANGNVQWYKTGGEMLNGFIHSLVETSDEGYALAGEYYPIGAESGDSWLVKTDASGNIEWNQTYGGTAWDVAYSVVEALDGAYALCGATMSFGAGGQDFWLVKTNEFGVVPEYSSWLIPALVLTATVFIIVNKKRPLRTRS
jgi:hypothetical protein